jgi:hypothetical protein
MDVWEVTEADDDPDSPNQEPDGEWKTLERVVPVLTVEVNVVSIRTVQADDAYINGPVHEMIQRAAGSRSAKYMGDWLSEGSRRVRGFYNGDLVTVWGQKASSGGIIPKELFAGDRVTFIESQHATAKGLLIAGISMMVCSPIVMVVGILASMFGRRKQ